MSVVNKMLQDLEKRRQQPQSADYQPPAKGRSGWWLFGVLPLVLLAVAAYWLLPGWMENTLSEQATETQPRLASAPAQPAKVSPDPAETIRPAAEIPLPAPDQVTVNQPPEAGDSTLWEQQAVDEQPEQQPSMSPAVPVAEPESQAAERSAFSIKNAGNDEEARWAMLKARVQQAIADQRPLDAITDLKRMLALQGDNHALRMKLAALMHDTGMQAQSGLLLEEGVKLYPQQTDLRLMLARWLQGNDRSEQALALLEELQPELLQNAGYFALRAHLAQQQDKLELAISDYLLLSQYQPDKFKWRLGLAVALDRAGRLPAALEQYSWLKRQNLPPEARQFVQQRLQVLGG